MMVTIRPATIEDIPVLVELQQRLALETENMALSEITLEKGLRIMLNDPNKGCYYVAEITDRIVGCFMVTYEWSEWRSGTFYWLQSVYVRREHRGSGIFKKMYAYLMALINTHPELLGLRLYANKSNIKAQDVYRALGMDGEHNVMFEMMKDTK
jgi:L-amino acid N-acyltransferase YncA